MTTPITPDAPVAAVATAYPATVAVFQRHGIGFCCDAGTASLADACLERGLLQAELLTELTAAIVEPTPDTGWEEATIADLVRHIQEKYHEPLRAELPRLAALLTRVVDRHGHSYPDRLLPLRDHFERMAAEMIHHMGKEDAALFPALTRLEVVSNTEAGGQWYWIEHPIRVMEAEHASADGELAAMREVTLDYALPEGACPTFRALYYGLEQLERDMQTHVSLENDILFPRAEKLARGLEA